MNRLEHVWRRLLPAMLVLACLAPAPRAQEGPELVEIDLGTIGLSTLGQLEPSRVFRPLDMIGVRPGARGWALGGAYVAQAEGVDAIGWNPAGMGWLKRPAAIGEFRWTRSSASTSGFPDTFNIPNAPQLRVNRYEVNLKSMVRTGILGAGGSREVFGHGVSGGLSYRRYMDVTLPESILAELLLEGSGGGNNANTGGSIALDNGERGGVDAAAATIGVELIPDQLAVGANFNVLNGIFRSTVRSSAPSGGLGESTGRERVKFEYRGISTDLGLQYRREGLAAVGVRFTPGYKLAVTGGRYEVQGIPLPGSEFVYLVHGVIAGYDIDVPPLLSVGGWYQVIPQLSVAIEYDSQKWADPKITYRSKTPFAGREANPTLPLRDVASLHYGLEGRFLKLGKGDLPVRVGYSTGPLSVAQLDPHGENPSLQSNWAGGDVKSSTMSLGVGFESGPLHYDLAYEIIDYKLNKWYFESPYDPFLNPQGILVKVDRRISQIRLGGTLSF
jgi:hypothetical protein